jgi:hypothetical protein
MLYYSHCPEHVLYMVQHENSNNQNEVPIKFLAPRKLKHALEELAAERNVALSALLRRLEVGRLGSWEIGRQAYTLHHHTAIIDRWFTCGYSRGDRESVRESVPSRA